MMLTASWCPVCKSGSRIITEIMGDDAAEIDITENQETLMRYRPKRLPHFILFRDGEEILQVSGTDLSAIREELQKDG